MLSNDSTTLIDPAAIALRFQAICQQAQQEQSEQRVLTYFQELADAGCLPDLFTAEVNPLHVACQYGWGDCVFYLLQHAKEKIMLKDAEGRAGLHYASQHNQLAIAQFLVEEAPAQLNMQDAAGFTPMDYAAQYGHLALLQNLIEQNPAQVVAYKRFPTLLLIACQYGHEDMMCWLADHFPALLEIPNSEGKTPLYLALETGCLKAARKFIGKLPPHAFAQQDNVGDSPFDMAYRLGHKQLAHWMLEINPRGKYQDDGQQTLIHAYENAHLDIVDWICAKNPNLLVTKIDASGQMPLHVLYQSHPEIKNHLASLSLDVVQDEDERSVLYNACLYGDFQVIRFLAEVYPRLVELEIQKEGNDILHKTLARGHMIVVQWLAEQSPALLAVEDSLFQLLQQSYKEVLTWNISWPAFLREEERMRGVMLDAALRKEDIKMLKQAAEVAPRWLITSNSLCETQVELDHYDWEANSLKKRTVKINCPIPLRALILWGREEIPQWNINWSKLFSSVKDQWGAALVVIAILREYFELAHWLTSLEPTWLRAELPITQQYVDERAEPAMMAVENISKVPDSLLSLKWDEVLVQGYLKKFRQLSTLFPKFLDELCIQERANCAEAAAGCGAFNILNDLYVIKPASFFKRVIRFAAKQAEIRTLWWALEKFPAELNGQINDESRMSALDLASTKQDGSEYGLAEAMKALLLWGAAIRSDLAVHGVLRQRVIEGYQRLREKDIDWRALQALPNFAGTADFATCCSQTIAKLNPDELELLPYYWAFQIYYLILHKDHSFGRQKDRAQVSPIVDIIFSYLTTADYYHLGQQCLRIVSQLALSMAALETTITQLEAIKAQEEFAEAEKTEKILAGVLFYQDCLHQNPMAPGAIYRFMSTPHEYTTSAGARFNFSGAVFESERLIRAKTTNQRSCLQIRDTLFGTLKTVIEGKAAAAGSRSTIPNPDSYRCVLQ